MFSKKIPETSIRRLSLYFRQLNSLEKSGVISISSLGLSQRLGFSDAQIRRDLSYFGQFGKSGIGYPVNQLKESISRILGLDNRAWNVALVGVGNLGSALLAYNGFKDQGFFIRAAFDSNPKKIGRNFSGIKIESLKKISSLIKERKITIGIIAVPSEVAQDTAYLLSKSGVKGILNFSPARINIPGKVIVRNVDLSMELENISYFLAAKGK
jgi:redox-sensing transcriptional repressor